ncbi:YheC/YheD family protein [bacterium]|nr:YheC/YheD family protein [candidate division CSSED10-310 bacterium]
MTVLSCDIGILAPFQPQKDKPLGQQTSFISGCLKEAKDLGCKPAIFNPISIMERPDPPFTGYYLASGKWCAGQFECPQIIYDRHYSTVGGFEKSIEQVKDYLAEDLKSIFINPLEFSRLATCKTTCSGKIIQYGFRTPGVLAERLISSKILNECLEKVSSIVVKPIYGRMGKGILRVRRAVHGYQVEDGIQKVSVSSADEVYGIISMHAKILEMETDYFFVQENIDIYQNKRRWFDVRCLVQRTNFAKPHVVGTAVRVSATGGNVPNIDKGGLAMDPIEWFGNLKKEERPDQILKSIEATALGIYQAFENEFGFIGEAGIDILADLTGKLWIIEVNVKPGRLVFQRLGSGFGLTETVKQQYRDKRKEAIRNPMIYAKCVLDERTEI